MTKNQVIPKDCAVEKKNSSLKIQSQTDVELSLVLWDVPLFS